MDRSGKWRVEFSNAAKKQKKKLPQTITSQLADLAWDLEQDGPVQPDWSHYSPLKRGKNIPPNPHHSHIKMAIQPMWFVGR